ncbi:MAG TPA: efflux RND transporter permease subunit, partial [Longimicrobiales bacterium]
MVISDFAIKRPVVTIVTMIALVAFGMTALFSLKTDELPDIQQPVVAVSVLYPGAGPEVVERELVDPIEEAISGINGIDKSFGYAQDGFAQVVTMFNFEKDLNDAAQETRDEVGAIRGKLPAEIEEPVITKFDPFEAAMIVLTLSSPQLSAAELTRLADPQITKLLRSVRGVAQAEIVGGIDRELTVQAHPDRLQAAGVSIAQLVLALQSQNLAAPVGRVTRASDERTIRLAGRLADPAQFEKVIVARSGDRVVTLGEVADITDGLEEPRSLATFNGKQAVGIEIIKAKGASTSAVSDAVEKKVEQIRAALPAGTTLDVVKDSGVRVEQSVGDVEMALLIGGLLTVLVVFLFLNSWRSTVITGLALPVSLLAAFIPVQMFGFTLNIMSLMGLSLAVGILIDDAIVVRENIVRHVERGKDHYDAARDGTAEIGLAVAATTFSIIAVFVPVAFMYGMAGQWFKPFALTIAASVLVSLFVSFSLDPMLSAYWPEPHREPGARVNIVTRTLDRFNHWFDVQSARYQDVIAWALHHRGMVFIITVGVFVGAFLLQGVFGGVDFVPQSDRGEINIVMDAPPGSSLDYTQSRAEAAAAAIRARKDVAYTYTNVGSQSGAVDRANIYVRLTPKADRPLSQPIIAREIRHELRRIAGADFAVFSNYFGLVEKDIQVQLRGPESVELTRIAQQVARAAASAPGAVDVGLSTRGQKSELAVNLNRALAGSLGISVMDVAQSLRPAFAGIDAGDWIDPSGETRDVMVRLTPQARRSAADLERLPLVVQGQDGLATVPLGQVAEIRERLGPAQINHLDGERAVIVQSNCEGRPFNDVVRDVRLRTAAVPLPPGYYINQGGSAEDQADFFSRIFIALGVAVMLMYLILVVQFGSFLDPLAILLSLPLSLIGVVLALIVTGDTVNIMSMIGVILLAGIVAKNAILLIDFAKWGQQHGMTLDAAVIAAGRTRLRPIIMTTVALIAGMLPVALGIGEGADFRAPLGRAVIGGTITSTMLTLIVIPTFYVAL